MLNVFVYGTLKPGEANYSSYCQGAIATPAWVRGCLYDLPMGYPALCAGDGRVFGFWLSFREASILWHLDRLEDYDPLRSKQANEYQRQLVWVYGVRDDRMLGIAWCYSMELERIRGFGGVELPSGWWSATTEKNYGESL